MAQICAAFLPHYTHDVRGASVTIFNFLVWNELMLVLVFITGVDKPALAL